MKLSDENIRLLKKLMKISAEKGNLATSGIVLENNIVIASAESWAASAFDATAHSERMLVGMVGELKHNSYYPGLTMITVIEPCLMCLSAVAQARYKELFYIIPSSRYIEKLPWITNDLTIDKQIIASQFTEPITLTHLSQYEEDFCQVFESAMRHDLQSN